MMKKVLSLLLCLIMVSLCFCIPAFAEGEEESETYPVNESVMAYYIWLMLSSWGISIGTSTMPEFDDSVEGKIIEWVMEYLATLPSAYTISTWIAPWQASLDYWGNFQGNASMVEDINDFGDWLVNFLSLEDDDTEVVDEVAVLVGDGRYNLYRINMPYLSTTLGTTSPNNGAHYISEIRTDAPTTAPIYYMIFKDSTVVNDPYVGSDPEVRGIRYVFLCEDQITVSSQYYLYNYSTDTWGGSWENQLYLTNRGLSRYYHVTIRPPYWNYLYDYHAVFIPQSAVVFYGTPTELETYLESAVIDTSGLYIRTGTINLPQSDPTYTTGDGITIVDDEPGYSVINFPDNMKVSNLPAVISEGTVPDPQLGNLFAPVSALITSMLPAMTIVQGIAYELPDILSTFFLTIVGCMIFFGFVKKLLE